MQNRKGTLERPQSFDKKASTRQVFTFSPRDPNFAHIEEQRASGRNIYKAWLDYAPRVKNPLPLKSFYTRFAAWRAAGEPEQFSRGANGAPVNVISANSINRAANGAPITDGGLAFIEQN